MTIQLDGDIQIDNLRHYPAETVDTLRSLLARGAEAQVDPRRSNFYDVYNCSQVFFIHISPVSGKVMLLARWSKEAQPSSPEKVCAN